MQLKIHWSWITWATISTLPPKQIFILNNFVPHFQLVNSFRLTHPKKLRSNPLLTFSPSPLHYSLSSSWSFDDYLHTPSFRNLRLVSFVCSQPNVSSTHSSGPALHFHPSLFSHSKVDSWNLTFIIFSIVL